MRNEYGEFVRCGCSGMGLCHEHNRAWAMKKKEMTKAEKKAAFKSFIGSKNKKKKWS